jgi:type I restriction enzyme R subunit
MLADAGWTVQSRAELNLGAARGMAVREFALKTGFAGYLLPEKALQLRLLGPPT